MPPIEESNEDCPACGATYQECSESRARGWDSCCMACDEVGQRVNHNENTSEKLEARALELKEKSRINQGRLF